MKRANAAAAASEERKRQEAIQLAVELGYKASTPSSPAAAVVVVDEKDNTFDFGGVFPKDFTWDSLISGEAVSSDKIKATGELFLLFDFYRFVSILIYISFNFAFDFECLV